jgi:hypothetical protein
MSLVAALLLAAVPSQASVDAGEIVVLADKLKDWKGTWGSKKGALACRTTRSTGDADIDTIGCQTLVTCATPLVPQFHAIAAAKLSRAERQRQMDSASRSMLPCLEQQREAGIAALADRRAGA